MRGPVLIGVALGLLGVLCGPISVELILALQVAPLPESLHFPVSFIFILCWFFPLVWFPIALTSPLFALTAIFVRQIRKYLAIAILVWFVSWAGLPVVWLFPPMRNSGLKRITSQAQPLINAIESYHAEKEEYPPDLQALVPEHISEIPYTGAVGYPHFRYNKANSDSRFEAYEVLVRTPMPGINFDVFVYWPEGDYPSKMYGGSVELINTWAYVHE